MLLRDRIIIVTGGANGLGQLYSENLAQEGARVVIADRDIVAAERLAAQLNDGAPQPRAVPIEVDVTSEKQTVAMAERTLAVYGRIDVILNNAGIYPHLDFDQITLDEW